MAGDTFRDLEMQPVTPECPEAGSQREREIHPSALLGRRRGRKLGGRQTFLLHTVLPRLSVDFSRPITGIPSLFPDKLSALWLEIGIGGGEHLAAEAKAHPDAGYIGCEFFLNGLAKTLVHIEADQLRNVRLHDGDARAVIEALPPASLDGAYLLYPDPWPKRRHRGRRFLTPETLERLARVMRQGAEIRFATDIDSNASWTLAQVLRADKFSWNPCCAEDWRLPWEGWTRTRYEAKALRSGRRPVYFTFLRK
jgi:tRNA (guanine-N7-)-methyltransferase